MMTLKRSITLIGLCATFVSPASADKFYPFPGPDSVKVTYPEGAGGAFWPESNLIQGPGIGFDKNEPHDKTLDGPVGNWVTDACAFPCSYIDTFGSPVLEFDLGENRLLTEISVWGYSDTNTNGMAEFELRFATATDGPTGYGTSVNYNPTFGTEDFFDFSSIERISYDFSQDVTARYVELVPTRNYFDPPGDGTGENGWPPGGDRVGIGEIAFRAPDDFVPPDPEPSVPFYEISDIVSSTEDTDFYPAINLIQGPGVGFLETPPHSLLSTGADGLWVTEACGFPCDYYEAFDPPELILDLGEDVELNEIDVWGYAATNSNGVMEFELEFATADEGTEGFGDSIDYNPTFDEVDIDPTIRQQFPFDQTVTARYVKLRALDNYFEEPGDGTGANGWPPGGDRVGLGEIAFPVPSDMLLGDFDKDGMLDVNDIDLLLKEAAAQTHAMAFDLNNDNNVNFDDIRIWVNDLANTYIGDANLDGVFNTTDLIEVFQAGKFETGNSASWSEGDWSGDGLFGTSDLILAFQDGGFEQGPKAAQAVPEPASAVLAIIGALAIGVIRRRSDTSKARSL